MLRKSQQKQTGWLRVRIKRAILYIEQFTDFIFISFVLVYFALKYDLRQISNKDSRSPWKTIVPNVPIIFFKSKLQKKKVFLKYCQLNIKNLIFNKTSQIQSSCQFSIVGPIIFQSLKHYAISAKKLNKTSQIQSSCQFSMVGPKIFQSLKHYANSA